MVKCCSMNSNQIPSHYKPFKFRCAVFSATEHGSKNYALIFPNAMLWQLAEKTPLTVEEMKREIDGLPETKINKYGAHRFLEVTTKYCVMLSCEFQLAHCNYLYRLLGAVRVN